MTSVFRIERLAAGDEQRLRAVRLRALAESPDAFGTTFAEALALPPDDWRQQLEQRATFVAADGAGDFAIARGGHDDEQSDVAWLLSMWVAPEWRRRGVAATLVDAVIQWARGEGLCRMRLDVTESNAEAIALYTRLGFVSNGTLSELPAPRQHIRECRMEREL